MEARRLSVVNYIRAQTPLIWLRTDEYDDAIGEIISQCNMSFREKIETQPNVSDNIVGVNGMHKQVAVTQPRLVFKRWDAVDGLSDLESSNNYRFVLKDLKKKPNNRNATLQTLKENDDITLQRMPAYPLMQAREYKSPTVLFLLDYHEFIHQVTIWRHLHNLYQELASKHITIVIISPNVNIPNEIADYFVVVDYEYPDTNWIVGEIRRFYEATRCGYQDYDACVNLAKGLTRQEFRRALIMSYANTNPQIITPYYISLAKESRIEKSPHLRILMPEGGFDSIIGMERMKSFTKQMVLSGRGRGILILGVPGTGKSAFSATLGLETGRTTISLDFATLMSGTVGSTEQNTERAIKIIDAMSPCILFIDEIEKGLAGVSGYSGDSGVAKRQGSIFLKWLSDHKSDVYVVATANAVHELPMEYKRAERWDTIFFVDVPEESQSLKILEHYMQYYGIKEEADRKMVYGLTGAEIRTICRIASAQGQTLAYARGFVRPITDQMGDTLMLLQEFADKVAIYAD